MQAPKDQSTMRPFSPPGRQRVTDAMANDAIKATARHRQPVDEEISFKPGDSVVYAAHGVGRIEKIGVQEIGGHKLNVIEVSFPNNQMTLRIPAATARASGLRQVASKEMVDQALAVIVGRPRVAKGPWSRRVIDIRTKITSGQLARVAEVVRDLRHHASSDQGSFSERQLFQDALERLTAEVALLAGEEIEAVSVRLLTLLKGAPAVVPPAAVEADAGEPDAEPEPDAEAEAEPNKDREIA